jgi:hypothetical protein
MANQKQELKSFCAFLTVIFGVLFLIGAVVWGPAGMSRGIQKWSVSAYGSDWLVVQYTQDGSIISVWELKDKSVASESNSDGINFVDDHGNMVHLAGHYVYVQVYGEEGLNQARKQLVEGRRRLGSQ